MKLSILIAQIISVLYLSMGIGLAFSKTYYNTALRKIVHDATYLLLGGWLATVLGVVLIHYHNIWVNDWRIMITLLSWIMLIKGTVLLAFPSFIRYFEGWFTPRGIQHYMLPMVIALGFIFGYFGFIY